MQAARPLRKGSMACHLIDGSPLGLFHAVVRPGSAPQEKRALTIPPGAADGALLFIEQPLGAAQTVDSCAGWRRLPGRVQKSLQKFLHKA